MQYTPIDRARHTFRPLRRVASHRLNNRWPHGVHRTSSATQAVKTNADIHSMHSTNAARCGVIIAEVHCQEITAAIGGCLCLARLNNLHRASNEPASVYFIMHMVAGVCLSVDIAACD